MFNFFDEIKKKLPKDSDFLCDYNLVDISGKMIYVEGHQGVTMITSDMLVFKVKIGRIVVEGRDLILSELTENTLLLQGKILKTEHVY